MTANKNPNRPRRGIEMPLATWEKLKVLADAEERSQNNMLEELINRRYAQTVDNDQDGTRGLLSDLMSALKAQQDK